jgi:hypothetical protein
LRATEHVAVLAQLEAEDVHGDKLLAEAVSMAKLLRRALDRANKGDMPEATDIAAVHAWIDNLQGILLRAITRPS